MSKVNPKIDLVFKKLFGTEKNSKLLKSLVNSILPEDEQVVTLELKNPYNLSDYISGKITYLDIKATDENGRWYDIEVQIEPYEVYGKRLLFYWSKLNASQVKRIKTDDNLRKTIVISLMDFNYFTDAEGTERFHRRIGLSDLDTNEVYEQTDDFTFQFIELKKFKKELPNIHSTLERWITFMNRAHEYSSDNLPAQLAADEDIRSAIEGLEIMAFNDTEQDHYESQLKKYLDELAYERQAQREKERQKKEIEHAKQRWKTEGKTEGKAEMAMELKKNGVPIEVIAKSSGLSIAEIENL